MEQEKWLRPRTSRVYLHPPLAQRLVLMWPELKITNSMLLDNGTHVSQPGAGLIVLHGEDMQAFDFKKTRFAPVQAGFPFYRVENEAECSVALEAFCDFQRNPATYFRIILKNGRAARAQGCIGVLCRSGNEAYMAQEHQEGYAPYKPNIKNWYMLKRTWRQTDENSAGDAAASMQLRVPDKCALRWVADGPKGHKFEAADYFRIDYALEPGGEALIEGVFRAGELSEGEKQFDYAQEKAAAQARWRELMADVQIVPDTKNRVYQDVYAHLAMQMYQMLARYEGSDMIATRQGDLGRFIWPYEAALVLTTMDKVGMRRYTGEAYRYFCKRWLVREGEDEGRIRSGCAEWENFTGMIVWGISEHLKATGDEAEFAYFLPKLMSMLGWIERRRTQNSGDYAGIFPVGRGSDWEDHAQFWTFTDSYNVWAIGSMAQTLALFGHEKAGDVQNIYEEYRARLIEIRDELYKGHEQDECFILPHELGVPFEDSETYSYYTDGAPVLLRTGLIEPDSRMRVQMENYLRGKGQFERGLTGLMTSCDGAWDGAYHGGYGDVWYTIQSELYWVPTWMAAGETEKAAETMDALMTYALTREYIPSERYCAIDEWYSPWQPNGSGCASLMQIMLSFFGEAARK